MDLVEDYLRNAARCDELAKSAGSEEHRKSLIAKAAVWRKAAELRMKVLSVSAPPPVKTG
jgi:hypothetical protein